MTGCWGRTAVSALAGTLTQGLMAAPTVLGIQDTQFTLNGQPTFLLGISYYGGLGAPEAAVTRDLDDMQRLGLNWLRVWATWAHSGDDVSAVDAQGHPRESYLGRLQWLVAECDGRGLAVDVTLTRGRGAGSVTDLAAHQEAARTLVAALRDHRNWYLDLANEHDVGDARFVSAEELEVLRNLVRRLDPQRLVTASFGGHDLTETDVREALLTAGLDFLSPHRPRHAGSPAETADKTREILRLSKGMGRAVPVHYQEPFRRGYGDWEPCARDFIEDLRGAVSDGAAGWCLHNGAQRNTSDGEPRRSFGLRTRRLFDQLDSEELKVTAQARFIVNGLPRLRVSDNRRFLVQEGGAPFFWLGDTAWWIRRLKPEEVEVYLTRRAQQGFNVVQIHPGYREADYAGNRPFVGDDPARPNEAFWTNMDAIVAAEGLHSVHQGSQLMTVHPGVARTSSLDFHAAPWLDFNMLQSGHAMDCEAFKLAENHALIAHDYALAPVKPVLDGEPIYEDTPDGIWMTRDVNAPRADAHAMRAKAYWSVFAGACGHTYGHNDVYGFHVPAAPGEVVQLPGGPGQRGDWRKALDAEGATQMVHVRTLMESRPSLDRIPDQALLVGEPGKGLDHVTATRAADGSYGMLYIPRSRTVTVSLEKLNGARVRMWWYDPRTGRAELVGESDRAGQRDFAPHGSGDGRDWVLVLDDADRDFAPPGRRR